MCYTSTKAGLLCALLLAMLHSPAQAVVAVQPDPGAQPPAPERTLEIATSGYSRFEISGEAVVAFYTGGVDASYAGYRLRCETLRINQVEQRAELTGGVAVTGRQASLSAPAVSINLREGRAQLGAGVSGTVLLSPPEQALRRELQVSCGTVRLSLLDAAQDPAAQNVLAELAGTVLLTAPGGLRLSTERVEYDGQASELRLPGSFVAEYELPSDGLLPAGQRGRQPAIPQKAYLQGAQLVANIDSTGSVGLASIEQPLLVTSGARLQARRGELQPLQGAARGGYSLELTGEPVTLAMTYQGQPLAMSARDLSIRSEEGASASLTLSGEVQIRGAGLAGSAQQIELRPGADGSMALSFPDGLRVGGDLAGISKRQPLRLEDLQQAK